MPGFYKQEDGVGRICLEDSYEGSQQINGFLVLESIFPNESDVRFGIAYGSVDDPGIGSLVLPTECDVAPGVTYGAPVCDA